MITVEFYLKDGLLSGFAASGHAGGKKSGENILCAFVSSACEMTANTITEIVKAEGETKVSEGFLKIQIDAPAETTQIAFEGLELHMKELKKTYPKEINIIYTEV